MPASRTSSSNVRRESGSHNAICDLEARQAVLPRLLFAPARPQQPLPAPPPDDRLLPDVQLLLAQPILKLRDRAGPALRALSLPAPEFGQAEPLLLRARRPPRPSVQPKRRLWRAIRLANMPMIQKEWRPHYARSDEHTSELQSLMRISNAVSCLKIQT